ncbi:putative RNA binding protein MSSP-2 [Aspergillus steynii IBT 23096]|uniref:Putative RNA binding protein MSSP-2 n=1 Tax=Aspergillus steynii IBT 23096 TaxID=1392250 RepID=A0A2I2FV58_9EURO|nr:putative RNA binding protein MSSP-2 [Aspergillus steynii IBT 23096]PLB44487.1 putative RNA binding protein MSSP-2 [Aspergillus steynii IBT 23096]
MNPQAQQTTASDSSQAPSGQSGQYSHESGHTPFVNGFSQMSSGSSRESVGPTLTPLYGPLSFPGQRPGGKFNPTKNHLQVAMPPGMDMPGAQRPGYNSPLVLMPNAPIFNGMGPVPPYTSSPVASPEQLGHLPYLPTTMYPNMNPSYPMMPTVQGYPFPYLMNCDIPDVAGPKRAHWASSEEQKVTASSSADNGNQSDYYTSSSNPNSENPVVQGFPFSQAPQMAPACVPYQMMKSSTGYILQDLESLTQQEPAIPRAVPAMWTNASELTLAKCLENREGITNVYIRGFLPETTDEVLHAFASRFGKIDRCKAIVDLDTGLCKGFGFVQFYNFESCENCIRGFFYLGYQASFAQKSRNSRLKDLEDKTSTNIYCTNLPIEWTEADLRHHFEPYRVVSEKISRDEKTGVSKEVGFARFETREIAEKVLSEYHNVVAPDGVKLLLRFADTKAQKLLKQQSNERRAYRAGEYNYSVEVVQGSTPSPSVNRLQQAISHLSPTSQNSYVSPVGVGATWTPATSISPSYPLVKNPVNNMRFNSMSSRNSPGNLENTPLHRGRMSVGRNSWMNTNATAGASKPSLPFTPRVGRRAGSSSSQKENIKAESLSPISSRREIVVHSPRSVV